MNLLFQNFDDPSFCIKDKKTFEFFLNLLKQLTIPDIQTNIMNLIFTVWENDLNQIEFIEFLINFNQPELFSFKNCQRKVKKNFELLVQTNKNNTNYLIEAWSSIDLIEVLFKISRKNNYAKVKELFVWPIENLPEIIVVGLSIIKTEGDEFLFDEVINETLPLFLGNHINSIVVLEEVWNLNRDLVIKTICNLYNSNPDLMNLSRILDITQKLKDSLIPIVSCNDHNFTVNLAILAVKRDFLHIDQWLSERISKIGDDFIENLLNYIKENVISLCKDVTSQTAKENILERCQLSLESLAIIFENLTPNKIGKYQNVSKRIEAEITNTYKAIFEIFDELQAQPPNSEEIEEAANKMYENLFHSEATITEIIDKMKSYRNSQNQKESEIYACMIHSLLDEYRFFYQYPERELTIIATLFGQIINQKLLDGIIETIALK
jgi:CCR4-NOT transcription complex subunit 1